MKGFRRRIRIGSVAFGFILLQAAAGGLSGQERLFADDNFAITPPRDWHLITNQAQRRGQIATFGNDAGSRLYLLLMDLPVKPSGPIDDGFVSEFDRGIQASGAGSKVSGRYLEIAGIKSYERVGTAVLKGKRVSTLMRVVPVDGRLYAVSAARLDGDSTDDAEVQKAVSSFRFLKPPVLSYSSKSSPGVTSDSTAYQIGYWTGRIAIIAVVVVAAVAFANRKTRRKPPPLPPSATL